MTEKAPPRPKGSGSIVAEKRNGRETGRWVGQLDITVGGGKRRRKKVTGANRTEVEQKLHALRIKEGMNVDVSQRSPTVAELVDQWRGHGCPRPGGSRQGKAESTLQALHRRLDDHLVPAIGRRRVDELRPEHVERWLADEAAKGYRHATILDYRGDVVQLLNWALGRRLVTWNVAQVAHVPEAADARDRTVLSRDEREQLFAALVDDRLEAYLVLLGELGLRPGEADALAWSSIDLDAGLVTIARAMKRGDGGAPLGIGVPKTKKSRRTLRLSARCVAVMRRHRTGQAAERLLAGPGWSRDERWTDLVFTSEVGTPMHPSNVRRALRKACERAGVPSITTYDLRHTVATLLCEDLPMTKVKDVLGHTDTRMLERVYRHAPDVVEAAAEVEDRHHIAGGSA